MFQTSMSRDQPKTSNCIIATCPVVYLTGIEQVFLFIIGVKMNTCALIGMSLFNICFQYKLTILYFKWCHISLIMKMHDCMIAKTIYLMDC